MKSARSTPVVREELARFVALTALQRVAAGDAAAVQEVIDRYGGLVWSLARRSCGADHDAEDAVQEIFLDVWKSSGRYDPSVASEATFIAMIARRRLIDRRRRKSRAPEMELSNEKLVASETIGDRAAVDEDAAKAATAMAALSAEQQRVLRLSIYQGLSHEKIARATGLPLGTVKTHARRGLIRVRELLAEMGLTASRPKNPAEVTP